MGEFGTAAYGTTLHWGTAPDPIAELTSIGGPSIRVDTIDVTSHDSANPFRDFIAGLGDAGEISIEGHFYSADPGQEDLINDMLDRQGREMVITFPDGTTFECGALVTAFEPSAPHDDKLSFSATLKLTGKPSWGVSYFGDLSVLTITTATLLPSLTAGVYSYTATTTGESVTVTPTCAGADSIEVWANGVLISTLASGGTSSAISAGAIGKNTPIQIRIIEAGYSTRVYNITLVKTA